MNTAFHIVNISVFSNLYVCRISFRTFCFGHSEDYTCNIILQHVNYVMGISFLMFVGGSLQFGVSYLIFIYLFFILIDACRST